MAPGRSKIQLETFLFEAQNIFQFLHLIYGHAEELEPTSVRHTTEANI